MKLEILGKIMVKNNNINWKILICGIGSIGRKYIKYIKLNWPEIKIAVLRSGIGSEFEEINVVDQIFFSKEDALNWSPDSVIICNPAPFHLELALFFGRKKIPLLIEKPVGTGKEPRDSWLELKKLNKDCLILIGYQLRFDPCSIYIKELLSQKKYGKALEAEFYCGSWLPDWRKDIDYRESVSAKESLGGGVLFELSHEIDLANWIFGKLKLVGYSVSNSGCLDIETDDNAVLIFRDKNNASITIRINFCSKPARRYLKVRTNICEIKWDVLNRSVKFDNHEKGQRILGKTNEELLLLQLTNFFECIKNNSNPRCSLNDGLEVLDIIKQITNIKKM